MAEEKPLTKSDLVAVLKEIGVATNDTVHIQLTEFYDGLIKPEFEKINGRLTILENTVTSLENAVTSLQEGQASLEDGFNRLEVGQEHIRTEIKELKADLSDTPSRAEHENLKARVNVLESRN